MTRPRTPMDGHAARRRASLLSGAAFGVVFLCLLWFPWPYHERLLDDGWSLALARFMQDGARAGADYVFTYGPLGYLAVPALVPQLFAIKYVWTVAFAAAGALAVVRAAGLFRASWQRVAFVWLALLSLPRTENRFFVAILLAGVLPAIERDFRPARLVVSATFLAVVSWIKFTYFGFAAAVVLLLGVAAPSSRERGSVAGGYLGALVVTWVAAGQSLLDLPRYVLRSLPIATGYSEGMSQAGDPRVTTAACAGALSMIAGVVLLRPGRDVWPAALMIAAGTFVAFKAAFVRQDAERSLVFFGYLAMASLACLLLSTGHARRAAVSALLLPVALFVIVPVAARRESLTSVLVPVPAIARAWQSAS